MGVFPAIPETDWKLVGQAAEGVCTPRNSAMEILLALYRPALCAYVKAKWALRTDRAEELVQEFIVKKVVEENLIAQARYDRGRFRNFMRATLDDFVVSQFRRDAAQKRSPSKMHRLETAEQVTDRAPDPRQAYEMAWAREVLATAVEAMRQECQNSARMDLWALFEQRILFPTLQGAAPAPYAQFVEQFGFRSPIQAANALTSAKRMFERNLRLVVLSYAVSEAEVDQEILDLQKILSGA